MQYITEWVCNTRYWTILRPLAVRITHWWVKGGHNFMKLTIPVKNRGQITKTCDVFYLRSSHQRDFLLHKRTKRNINLPQIIANRAKFHGSAYCKQRIGAERSRAFRASVKRTSEVNRVLLALHVHIPHSRHFLMLFLVFH